MVAPPPQALNDPPMLVPPPGMPGLPPIPGAPSAPVTTSDVAAALNSTAKNTPPLMGEVADSLVELPIGWLRSDGRLITTARVRELNGYDEEKLARFDSTRNVAKYVTEILAAGVEELGGEKPSHDTLRSLLIGDRDALLLGIRRVTYGNNVDFKLHCNTCDSDSDVYVEIDKDIPVQRLDDPLKRAFDVPLRRGTAKLVLLNGFAQEAFSENIDKKTPPEITSIMLAHSVVEIDGIQLHTDEDAVRRLSSADRGTLSDFMSEHQPGPQTTTPVMVPCATCGEEYPISLGLSNLFRF